MTMRTRVVLCLEFLLVCSTAARVLGNSKETLLPTDASVYGEVASSYPRHATQSVELLRFVTAYRTGFDSIVDITPYSPLLRAAADGDASLEVYTRIDTWVDNSTGRPIQYLNTTTGRCENQVEFHGNGWQLDADLLFWPADSTVDTRPRESVTVATGYFGSSYPIGDVSVHEGTMVQDGMAVQLDSAVDFSEVVNAPVYACSGGRAEVENQALMGFLAKEVEAFTRRNDSDGAEALSGYVYGVLGREWLLQVVVNSSEWQRESQHISGKFNPTSGHVEPGMPVFFSLSDVYVDRYIGNGMWSTSPHPFRPIGEVSAVNNDTLSLDLQYQCAPTTDSHGLPGLFVPSNPKALSRVEELVNSTKRFGTAAAASYGAASLLHRAIRDGVASEPLLLANASGSAAPLPLLGRVVLPPPAETTQSALISLQPAASPLHFVSAREQNGRVCVVAQRRQGRVLERAFELATVSSPKDRTLMQLVVTGHGWAATTEQCGEYCHAVYRLSFNGQSAANITQWRDDCRENPVGKRQHGTWFESRNGWCPGSVEPGLFVDVTGWVHPGKNRLAVDVVVWSNRTGEYVPYTDYAGFALGDHAKLTVGLTLFVYGQEAVQAVRSQEQAYTAAELALRQGSSLPSALAPPAHPRPYEETAMLLAERQPALRSPDEPEPIFFEHQSTALLHQKGMDAQVGQKQSQVEPASKRRGTRSPDAAVARYDVEARAPWYLYNESTDEIADGVRSVPVFVRRLVQGTSQIALAGLGAEALPATWGQVALRMRLSKPPGDLKFDHWDRECSLGLLLRNNSAHLHLNPAKARRRSSNLAVRPVEG